MYGLAQIYTGCLCGETWDVAPVEIIDTAHDRVETVLYCKKCGRDTLKEKRTPEGTPYYHAVTEEEHLVLSGFYEDPSDDLENDNLLEDELDEFYDTKNYDDVDEKDYGTHGDGDLPF